MIGFKLVVSVCIGAVFGMLGGLLGVALFKKKDLPPAPGPSTSSRQHLSRGCPSDSDTSLGAASPARSVRVARSLPLARDCAL